jgi:hypothetical protein
MRNEHDGLKEWMAATSSPRQGLPKNKVALVAHFQAIYYFLSCIFIDILPCSIEN